MKNQETKEQKSHWRQLELVQSMGLGGHLEEESHLKTKLLQQLDEDDLKWKQRAK